MTPTFYIERGFLRFAIATLIEEKTQEFWCVYTAAFSSVETQQ